MCRYSSVLLLVLLLGCSKAPQEPAPSEQTQGSKRTERGTRLLVVSKAEEPQFSTSDFHQTSKWLFSLMKPYWNAGDNEVARERARGMIQSTLKEILGKVVVWEWQVKEVKQQGVIVKDIRNQLTKENRESGFHNYITVELPSDRLIHESNKDYLASLKENDRILVQGRVASVSIDDKLDGSLVLRLDMTQIKKP